MLLTQLTIVGLQQLANFLRNKRTNAVEDKSYNFRNVRAIPWALLTSAREFRAPKTTLTSIRRRIYQADLVRPSWLFKYSHSERSASENRMKAGFRIERENDSMVDR